MASSSKENEFGIRFYRGICDYCKGTAKSSYRWENFYLDWKCSHCLGLGSKSKLKNALKDHTQKSIPSPVRKLAMEWGFMRIPSNGGPWFGSVIRDGVLNAYVLFRMRATDEDRRRMLDAGIAPTEWIEVGGIDNAEVPMKEWLWSEYPLTSSEAFRFQEIMK